IEVAIARAAEFRVVALRGPAGPGVPFAPAEWPQPFGALARRLGLAEGAGTVTVTEPPVGAVPDRAVPDGAVPAVAEAVGQLAASSGRPVLVTVDDCHALPAWFVNALAQAAGRTAIEPVGVVLAWNDLPHQPAPPPVERGVPRHRLAGLTEQQAAKLLSVRFDRVPAGPILSELVAGTGGNPLALVETCGRLTTDHLDGWQPLPDPLPVGELVAGLFDVGRQLPGSAREALAVAAAARVPTGTLAAVLRRLGHDTESLRAAVDAGILAERGPRLEFVHPLVRAAAYLAVPGSVRTAVRRAFSDELASRHAVEPSAFHAALDADAPDDGVSRRLAQAARVAVERGDSGAAARYEERAAQFAVGHAAAVHWAAAAGLWFAVGRRQRAAHCLDAVTTVPVDDGVLGELAYQRARLAGVHPVAVGSPGVAGEMVAAADRCVADAPNRAV